MAPLRISSLRSVFNRIHCAQQKFLYSNAFKVHPGGAGCCREAISMHGVHGNLTSSHADGACSLNNLHGDILKLTKPMGYVFSKHRHSPTLNKLCLEDAGCDIPVPHKKTQMEKTFPKLTHHHHHGMAATYFLPLLAVLADDGQPDFDLEIVLKGFKECQGEDSELKLADYLYAFTELTRFFRLMGRLFGFIASDLESQISFLTILEKSSDENKTIQSMLAHEKTTGNTCGSKCLQELHWDLEYIGEFMAELLTATNDGSTSEIAARVYERTLAMHHNWLMRKMAVLAMYTLPRRDMLIKSMCKQDSEQVNVLLNKVVKEIKIICQVTENNLKEYGVG